MVNINHDILTFANGTQIKLPAAIPAEANGYVHEHENIVLVINNTVSPNNIWCFDQNGEKLWEIEPSIWDSPYHDIQVNDQGEVRAYDQRGDTYLLDVDTGYVQWIGGDRGGDAEGANAFIRKRRNGSS